MIAIKLSFSWVEFPSNADELCLQATFAQFWVVVGDVNVTRVVDRRGQTTRDFVTIPLYPLAEWIAANWWPLFEEAEVPSRGTPSSDYRRRHALHVGREGYAFPDLQFVPEGSWTVVKWSPSRTAYQSVEFLETGQERLETDQVRQELSDFIDSVIDRLEAKKIHDTWLQKEWRAINEMSADEADFCRAAGRLGLDPYQLSDGQGDEILNASARLPDALFKEVLTAAPATLLTPSVSWVESGLEAIRSNNFVDGKWVELRDRLAAPAQQGLPWESGYALAQELRSVLALEDAHPVDIDQIVNSPLPVIPAQAPPSASFEGLMGVGGSSLCCYTGKLHRNAQRFLCARGLIAFLYDKSNRIDLYSSAITNTQKRSRAFAAEFLAPASLIRQSMSGDEISSEEVESLASQFQVSAFVIDHQIFNHQLGKIIS